MCMCVCKCQMLTFYFCRFWTLLKPVVSQVFVSPPRTVHIELGRRVVHVLLIIISPKRTRKARGSAPFLLLFPPFGRDLKATPS